MSKFEASRPQWVNNHIYVIHITYHGTVTSITVHDTMSALCEAKAQILCDILNDANQPRTSFLKTAPASNLKSSNGNTLVEVIAHDLQKTIDKIIKETSL